MVKIDFNKVNHDPSIKFNKLIVSSLITDIFFEYIENECYSISQNEILHLLGVPEKDIDLYDVVIYDMKTIRKKIENYDKSMIYDMVESRINQIDFDNREFA